MLFASQIDLIMNNTTNIEVYEKETAIRNAARQNKFYVYPYDLGKKLMLLYSFVLMKRMFCFFPIGTGSARKNMNEVLGYHFYQWFVPSVPPGSLV